MIVNNEITFATSRHEDSVVSWSIKSTITVSTIILVGLLCYYHQLDLSLYCIQNSVLYWYVGLTSKKIFLIAVEIFICCIHPIPHWNLNVLTTSSLQNSNLSIDIALSLLSKYKSLLNCCNISFEKCLPVCI